MTSSTKKNRILVTSGPTRAWIDRVRYIANASTGALGAAIVETLAEKNHRVLHIVGRGAVLPVVPRGSTIETRVVETIEDLVGEVRNAAAEGGIGAIIHAMAVLDYVPERRMDEKRPSDSESWDIRLVRTPKVTAIMRELMPDARFIGFKLETGVSMDELVHRAHVSLRTHNLDLVVANDLNTVGADHHEAVFVDPSGAIAARAETKKDIALAIAALIHERFGL